MIEMTLSSRHRIRNSSPGGLRPSTLPLGHGGSPQYWLSHVDGEETFLFLWNRRDREPNPELVKGSGANHYPRAPAHLERKHVKLYTIIWSLKIWPSKLSNSLEKKIWLPRVCEQKSSFNINGKTYSRDQKICKITPTMKWSSLSH